MINILVYFLGNGLAKLFPFLMVPIFTRHLGLSEFGQVSLYYAFFQVLVVLIGFSSQSLVTMNYYDKEDGAGVAGLGSVKYAVIIAVINLIVALIICVPLGIYFGYGALYCCALAAFFYQLLQILGGIFHVKQEAVKFVAVIFISCFSAFLLSITFLDLGAGVLSRVYGDLLAFFLFGSAAGFYLYKMNLLGCGLNSDALKSSYIVLIPLMVHGVSVFAIYAADRFILLTLVGAEAVGLYSAAFVLGQVVLLVVDSKSRVWTPFVAKKNRDNPSELSWYIKVGAIYLSVLSIFCIVYYLVLGKFLGIMLGDEYIGAIKFLPFIIIGFLGEAVYREFHVHIFLAKKTSVIGKITVVIGALHVIISFYFISILGVAGAALAFAISSSIKALIVAISLRYIEVGRFNV